MKNIANTCSSHIEKQPTSTSVKHSSNKQLYKTLFDLCKTRAISVPNDFEHNINTLSDDNLNIILDNKLKELNILLDKYFLDEGAYQKDININSIIEDSVCTFNQQLLNGGSYFNQNKINNFKIKINQIFDKLKKVLYPTEMSPIGTLKSISIGYISNRDLCKYYCDFCKDNGVQYPNNFEQDIKKLSEYTLSDLLYNKPQQFKQLLDIYYKSCDKPSKIDIRLIIAHQVELFAKILEQPGQSCKYLKQIDLNMADLSAEILKIEINNNKTVSPKLVTFVKLGQPSITQTKLGTVINQGNLGTCQLLVMIMACSNYDQIIMPIAEENDTTNEVDLYLPSSALKLDQSDLDKLHNNGINCHVNKEGIIDKMTITSTVCKQIKQQRSATSNNQPYNLMLKFLEWLVVHELEVFSVLGSHKQEAKFTALLGLKVIYNSLLEHGTNLHIGYIKDKTIQDALQIMAPASPELVNSDIQIRYGLKFNIDNANSDPGNHAVLFKKTVIRNGVHWIQYLNPWGEVEYITVNQLIEQLANSSISVYAPIHTTINAKSIKHELFTNNNVLLEDSRLGKSGMDLNQGVLLNNGDLVTGEVKCLGLTFYDGLLLTGFHPDSGVYYKKGKKFQPEIVKLKDVVYIKINGQMQKLNNIVFRDSYYVNGQKAFAEYKNGKLLVGGKPFSGVDINTNILYKSGTRYTGLVKICEQVFKYVVGFQDYEVKTPLTEDENSNLYIVNSNAKISI